MTRLEQIEAQIVELSEEERAKLRAWLDELDEYEWDRQIEEDSRLGRLDHIVDRVKKDVEQGRYTEL